MKASDHWQQMYSDAIIAEIQALDKLQRIGYMLGVPMGLGPNATFELLQHHLDELFGTLKVVAQTTTDETTKEILTRKIDDYSRNKSKLKESEEKTQ